MNGSEHDLAHALVDRAVWGPVPIVATPDKAVIVVWVRGEDRGWALGPSRIPMALHDRRHGQQVVRRLLDVA